MLIWVFVHRSFLTKFWNPSSELYIDYEVMSYEYETKLHPTKSYTHQLASLYVQTYTEKLYITFWVIKDQKCQFGLHLVNEY